MIAGAIASLFASYTVDPIHPRDPALSRMFGMGRSSIAGVDVTHEKVMAIPAIKRAVQIITDKMFGMPWYVFEEQEKGREFDRTHPAWRCVNAQANENTTAPALRQQLTQWAMTYGNGCAVIDRSNPLEYELIPLLPDRTKPLIVTKSQAEVIGDASMVGRLFIRSKVGDEWRTFDKRDVLHIKGLGPDPFWGWDLSELLVDVFGGAMAKDEFGNRYFSNGANPTGFIEMDGSLDEESEENRMESLSKAMSGLGKSHKVVLLEDGMKFKAAMFDPEKSQMLESRQFDVRSLAMAIGIKVHKLIDGANSAFASLEQANHEHKDDDILPWVNKFRVEYDRRLLSDQEQRTLSRSIDLDDEALNWVPFSDRASGSVELYNNGLITKDEGRRKVNFGPSRSKRSSSYRIPANIVYEDDQPILPDSRPAEREEKESEPESRVEEFAEVSEPYLNKIACRIAKIAKDKAAKSSGAFLLWLDELKPESGPKSIQPKIDQLFADFSVRMNACASKAKTEAELRELVSCEPM